MHPVRGSVFFGSSLLLLATSLAACDSGGDGSSLPTWEEFKAEATRTFEGQEIYVLDFDDAVTLDELRQAYDRHVARARVDGQIQSQSTVHNVGGAPDLWNAADRQNLTYCVSTDFGSLYGRAVAEMRNATRAWETAANVDFRYLPANDSACNNTNTAVRFSVRPWTSGGACAFFPSGGGCVARTIVINYNDLDTNPFYDTNAPNMTTEGVLRHELGHVLGLRHEHVRSGTCSESSWLPVTEYDKPSVMHYQWCNGVTTSNMQLTAADRRGVEALYGRPSPEPAPHAGMRVRLRHATTDNCQYSVGGNGGKVHNFQCWNDPNMTYVLEAATGGFRLRHEASGQCTYAVPGNGTSVFHWGCWNDPGMVFQLVPFFGGYRLRHAATGQSLYGDSTDGAEIHSWGDWADLGMLYLVDALAWSPWIDVDNPSGTGDYESISNSPCAAPTAIRCETLDGVSHASNGEVVTCNTTSGFSCVNSSQPDGACEDYRVSFYCP